tara:strand:+ start:63 stop:350 length:288 start_codon:yes stop_codon:yes gene_type:complete
VDVLVGDAESLCVLWDVIVEDEICFCDEVVELVFAFVGFQINGGTFFACVEESPPAASSPSGMEAPDADHVRNGSPTGDSSLRTSAPASVRSLPM